MSLWHVCFPANLAKVLRIPFFTEHLLWLLLQLIADVLQKAVLIKFAIFTGKHLCWSLLQACNFIKMRFQFRCFLVNIANIPFKNTISTIQEEHLRTVASQGSFYVKNEILISFISNFKQSKRKICISIFTVLFSFVLVFFTSKQVGSINKFLNNTSENAGDEPKQKNAQQKQHRQEFHYQYKK